MNLPLRVKDIRGSQFVVIVPVKSLDSAKSRLEVGILRPLFALAFATDVCLALLRSSSTSAIYVLTSDDRVRDLLPACVGFIRDTGTGLNTELLRAFDAVRRLHPRAPIAVVFADLPAMTSEGFDSAASAALLVGSPSFVPDADGRGTTMLFTQTSFRGMYFGDRSSHHFELSGMQKLEVGDELKRDVDTLHNLEDASKMGLSRWTRLAAETARRFDTGTRAALRDHGSSVRS